MLNYSLEEYELFNKLLNDPKVNKKNKDVFYIYKKIERNDFNKNNSKTPTKTKNLKKVEKYSLLENKPLKIEAKVRDKKIQDKFIKNTVKEGFKPLPETYTQIEPTQFCHILPYCQSNENEKVDGLNGIQLSPALHRLFDLGFITWDYKTGIFSISTSIPTEDYFSHRVIFKYLKENPLPIKENKYFKIHNEKIFKK